MHDMDIRVVKRSVDTFKIPFYERRKDVGGKHSIDMFKTFCRFKDLKLKLRPWFGTKPFGDKTFQIKQAMKRDLLYYGHCSLIGYKMGCSAYFFQGRIK